ncbi:hypothetical protein Pint_25024 [Pistacia integerrima]|uniref:Uncharacterized protein n=1 Tax=Pistacia integerrima TaxID=434235 RepID=A0ACC0YC07_9ROSI|nr:hypothetical protein Pint_25024 [Pistacia integerrima]
MASFCLLVLLLFMNSPLLSLASDHHLNSETSPSSISASPAFLTSPTYQELSPDISPLLPSPGGVVPTPTGSSVPTIPSNPSPPNPDAPGPAFSPFSQLPAAYSMAQRNLVGQLKKLPLYVATFWSCHHLLRI